MSAKCGTESIYSGGAPEFIPGFVMRASVAHV